MKKLILLILLAIPAAFDASAFQKDTLVVDELPNEYLDTVKVYRKRLINDYSMIGVNYGVAFCNMSFNPSRQNRATQICPNHISLMYTHYEKLFQRYANFAFHIGFEYSHEGAGFKKDNETGEYYNTIDGAAITAETDADWLTVSTSANKVVFKPTTYHFEDEGADPREAFVVAAEREATSALRLTELLVVPMASALEALLTLLPLTVPLG